MPSFASLKRAQSHLREFAMDYPDTVEEFPWGHSAFKVKRKVFLFMALHKGVLSLSMKLPKSGKRALKNKFASPTEYGMGKHGWVTCRFEPGTPIPMDVLTDWIDESFRAIAPKKIVEYLDMHDDAIEAPVIKSRKK